MKLVHLTATFATTALLAAGLTACSEDRSDDALTIEEDDENTRNDDDQEAEAPGDEIDGAGRLLTADDIEAALPTVEDFPTGWSRDPDNEDEDDDEDDTITPERCEDLFGDDAEQEEPLAEATRAFKESDFGPFVSVDISTYDDEVPDDTLDELAEALSECKEFTSVDSEGSRSTVTAEALSFPNLGDETFAVRMSLETEFLPAAVDLAMVRVGHNLVLLATVALGGGTDTGLLEDVGRKTIERLAG